MISIKISIRIISAIKARQNRRKITIKEKIIKTSANLILSKKNRINKQIKKLNNNNPTILSIFSYL